MSFENDSWDLTNYLVDHGFEILERAQNFIRLDKGEISLRICRDPRDRLLYPSLSKDNNTFYELLPEVAEELGDAQFKFQSTLTFENLLTFFQGAGRELISGEPKSFQRIIDFHRRRTEGLDEKWRNHMLETSATSFWEAQNYQAFVQLYDELKPAQRTDILSKRYRIALKKIKSQA